MFDIHQSIFDENGEMDEDRVDEFTDGIMAEFAASSEGKLIVEEFGSIGWTASMIHYATHYVGAEPAKMSVAEFNEVLFDLFPRKVSAPAEQARSIFMELCAFWGFVARQFGLDNAQRIVRSMDDQAAAQFEKDLANSAKFGMAKSFFMAGTLAGYDMTKSADLAAFQAQFNASLPTNLPPLPLPGIFDPFPGSPFGDIPGKSTGAA